MVITENGLDFSSVYITFENPMLCSLIQSFFPASLRENYNTLEPNSLVVDQGDFFYRGHSSIEGTHMHDFFVEPQKSRNENYSRWELPLGPKNLVLFAPLFARIIENNFSDCTQPLVQKLVAEREEIAKHFISFKWIHTDEGDTVDDDGNACFEKVITKFIYTGNKIKKTRKRTRTQ